MRYIPLVNWEVELHDEVVRWFEELCRTDPRTANLVEQAVDLLAELGPTLGRPLVDRVKGSCYHHMKELRPASAGATEVRVLFAFDPLRKAILLIAGDKSGAWKAWYEETIPVAEQRYAAHIASLNNEER